ncbi:site-specific integrase [Rhodoferax sp.]|uniref:site-specific integrase n=1 Tax=Rhodoferax sp. TaxID=50421 RepID=UPI002844FD8B|nr:site-specific integrase [Rhodoferax sp.]MDR3367993.1 site-specific integrase [Rhodoferax sp.]
MASIENRSRFVVEVHKAPELTQTFAYNREPALKAYLADLDSRGYKPKLSRTDDSFAIRIREGAHPKQCLYASTEGEAVGIKQKIEEERNRSLFIDYAQGFRVTFADLLARYLREISPRHKGFEIEGYLINAILEDAGLARVDIAKAYADHKNPHPSHASKKFAKPSGKGIRTPSVTSCFVRKSFGALMPEDFNEYIDDRCQAVAASSVDREVDIFSAVCRLAIDTWRIPVAKSPMDGVRRPKYFNERDRRLKADEEQRLLSAAYDEDAQQSIELRLEELTGEERAASCQSPTTYQRKNIVKAARIKHREEAQASYTHVPWMETFIQFQLMTGARRSETLSLTWDNIDFDNQTAFIPETKNGRPRKLPLRKDIIALLQQLPRNAERVFSITLDTLRNAWDRICKQAGLVDVDELHVHDLRHEAISRVADAGGKLPGGFSLVDLQAFSGHRDTRMLLRYTHLCTPSLAKRLDAAFADQSQTVIHRGQRRLKNGSSLTMKEVINTQAPLDTVAAGPLPAPQATANNVIAFRPRLAA